MDPLKLQRTIEQKIEVFVNLTRPLFDLCAQYVPTFCDPMLNAVRKYSINYRSNDMYRIVHQSFRHYGLGTANLLNRVLRIHNPQTQNSVFTHRRQIFKLLAASGDIMAAVLELAYATSTQNRYRELGSIEDTCIGRNIPEKTCSRKIGGGGGGGGQIHVPERRYYLLQQSLQTSKKCRLAPYAEEGYLMSLKEWCQKNGNNNVMANFCSWTTEMITVKETIMNKQNERILTIADIERLLSTWTSYRPMLLDFTLGNFLILSQSVLVSCLEKFLEEQHALMLSMRELKTKLEQMQTDPLYDDLQMTTPTTTTSTVI